MNENKYSNKILIEETIISYRDPESGIKITMGELKVSSFRRLHGFEKWTPKELLGDHK